MSSRATFDRLGAFTRCRLDPSTGPRLVLWFCPHRTRSGRGYRSGAFGRSRKVFGSTDLIRRPAASRPAWHPNGRDRRSADAARLQLLGDARQRQCQDIAISQLGSDGLVGRAYLGKSRSRSPPETVDSVCERLGPAQRLPAIVRGRSYKAATTKQKIEGDGHAIVILRHARCGVCRDDGKAGDGFAAVALPHIV